MKFKFYPRESRIYDFLQFPRLLYSKEEFEKKKEDVNYQNILIEDYLSFVSKIEDRLKPFADEIGKFYVNQYLSDYDFIDLISRTTGIMGFQNEKDYLDMLLSLDEYDIRKSIVHSIMLINDEYPDDLHETMKKANEICLNYEDIISFIKELPIEAGAKWNFFLIVEEPLKHMKIYVNLMKKLLPIFNEIYTPYEKKVKDYGEYLVEFLNNNGAKGLEEITYSIVNINIFDEKEINIFISIIFSYALSIITAKTNYIAWGLRMEEAFKKMKEINENKTLERVQIFKNLGDKTRYEVLKLIAAGETSTKVIAKTLGVSSATISYHLNNLLTSKVIKMDKSNNKFGYAVDYELLKNTIEGFKKDLNFTK
ncbi:winged helix-turn-helix domain-containing protein [Schnuerera sp.]|uniref:ArsR/SmtB family transcription factor n=1 Tax=Schnuerera sp. TaxID=2794844 RepID=UPI002C829A5C|nr:winged helix-turn-helix domain-containing protein [Schnuerera sp.]HSH37036.1 winged helix-turn-helix domain-containing protein [Schnuerera sp.]